MSEFVLNAIIKGLIEGVTEFIPVSSTGHLILAREYFPIAAGSPENIDRMNNLFDIIIQFPAVLAIVFLYRKRLWESVRATSADVGARRFWMGLLLAVVPIATVGILLKKKIELYLMQPTPVAVALIVGGIILMLIEKMLTQDRIERAEDVPMKTAGGIGLYQCLALIPGTSRSGATIVGGRLMGLSPGAAAEFSFFLALPTMGAAFAYSLYKSRELLDLSTQGPVLLAGCIASFVSAAAVVYGFMWLLKKYRHSLALFGIYRIILGIIVLLTLK